MDFIISLGKLSRGLDVEIERIESTHNTIETVKSKEPAW